MPNNLVVESATRRASPSSGSAFALFASGKTMRAVAAFAAFHALRSHRLPVLFYLLVATSGAAISVLAVQQPWNGKPISSNKFVKLFLGGLILASTLTLWTLGLRECGPLRTLIMDGAEMPLYYLFSVYMKREKTDRRKTKGTILIIIAYLLLMFDASDRAPSAHGILRRTKMGREVDERIVRFKNGTMAKLYHFTEENLDKGSNLLRKHNLKPAATKKGLNKFEKTKFNKGPSRRLLAEKVDAPPVHAQGEDSPPVHAQGEDAPPAQPAENAAEHEEELPPLKAEMKGGERVKGNAGNVDTSADNIEPDDTKVVIEGQANDDHEDEIDTNEKDEEIGKGGLTAGSADLVDGSDLDSDDYDDVTGEYDQYEDEYDDYYDTFKEEEDLDAPALKDKDVLLRSISAMEMSMHRKPYRVLGVLLVLTSSVITQASRGYTRHIAAEIGGAKRYFSLSLATAWVSLLVPGMISFFMASTPVHLSFVSFLQFLFVGFLWLVFPYYIRSVVSTKLNAKILLKAGVIVPFIFAFLASALFGYGQSAGGVTFLVVLSFVLSSGGFKLVMSEMRQGAELPMDVRDTATTD